MKIINKNYLQNYSHACPNQMRVMIKFKMKKYLLKIKKQS